MALGCVPVVACAGNMLGSHAKPGAAVLFFFFPFCLGCREAIPDLPGLLAIASFTQSFTQSWQLPSLCLFPGACRRVSACKWGKDQTPWARSLSLSHSRQSGCLLAANMAV